MFRCIPAAAAFILLCSGIARSQEPPQGDRERQLLGYFAGTWKITSEMKSTALGPAGPMMATEQCEWYPGGFHLVCQSDGTGPTGEVHSMALMSYDEAKRRHVYYAISSMAPDAELATGTKTADGWSWTSESRADRKTVRSRFTMFSMTSANYQMKWEVNDGSGWSTIMTGTAVKIR